MTGHTYVHQLARQMPAGSKATKLLNERLWRDRREPAEMLRERIRARSFFRSVISRYLESIKSGILALRRTLGGKMLRVKWDEILASGQRFVVALSLTGIGLILFFYGVRFLIAEEVANALSCIGAGVAVFFSSAIDRFESLKAFGFEAKTRELDKVIAEAQVTIKQFSDLTKTVSGPIARLYCGPDTWDREPSLKDKTRIAMNLKEQLEGVGSSENEIREMLAPWLESAARDALDVVQAYITAELRDSMISLNAALSVASTDQEKSDISAKIGELINYERTQLNTFAGHTFQSALNFLDKSAPLAPLYKEASRQSSKEMAAKAANEIRHLAKYLQFGDEYFWKEVASRSSVS